VSLTIRFGVHALAIVHSPAWLSSPAAATVHADTNAPAAVGSADARTAGPLAGRTGRKRETDRSGRTLGCSGGGSGRATPRPRRTLGAARSLAR